MLIISLLVGVAYKYYLYLDNKIFELNEEVVNLKSVVNALKSNKEDNKDEIIKYEIKNTESFNYKTNVNKYVINSLEELNDFYSIYKEDLNINKDYLKDNSIFIQVEGAVSSNNKVKLNSISFENNKINFNIEKSSGNGIGLTVMSNWYLIAVIPNYKLENINLDDWSKPSQILNNITE